MSKHEIRLRRQKMTARGAERFRNYGAILERHEQEMRLKKIIRSFTMFLIVLIMIMLIVIVVRVERKAKKKEPTTSAVIDISDRDMRFDKVLNSLSLPAEGPV